MLNMAEIREQFSALNSHIATALTDKDFNRAVTLDQARQDILKELCLMDMSGIDESFSPLLSSVLKTMQSSLKPLKKRWRSLPSAKAAPAKHM